MYLNIGGDRFVESTFEVEVLEPGIPKYPHSKFYKQHKMKYKINVVFTLSSKALSRLAVRCEWEEIHTNVDIYTLV